MTLANRVTLLRVALVPVYVLLMYLKYPYANFVAAGFFLLVSLTDMVDGHLARSRNEVSTFGKFLDPIADKILVMAAFVVLVEQGKISAVFAMIFLAREFIISGFREIAAARNTIIAASHIAKVKTFSQMTAIIFLTIDNFPFSLIGIPVDQILLWFAAVMTVWSGIDYLVRNRKLLAEP